MICTHIEQSRLRNAAISYMIGFINTPKESLLAKRWQLVKSCPRHLKKSPTRVVRKS